MSCIFIQVATNYTLMSTKTTTKQRKINSLPIIPNEPNNQQLLSPRVTELSCERWLLPVTVSRKCRQRFTELPQALRAAPLHMRWWMIVTWSELRLQSYQAQYISNTGAHVQIKALSQKHTRVLKIY